MTTPRSPLLDLPGAVAADRPDTGVAAHYGSDLREQRTLADGTGLVDLSHRDVVTVAGPERLDWLNSLTSQQLTGLAPGQGTTALVLDPQGHVEHVLYGVDDGEVFWAHTEPGCGAPLVEWLTSMVFMTRVEPRLRTEGYAVLWRPGQAGDGLTRSGADSLGGYETFLPRADLAGFADQVGEPAGMWAYEARRIAAGMPRFGADTDERTLPNEAGWIDVAVHLNKGCYRGQETVARVHNLGRPPRRLVRLHLDGSADRLPVHGDPIVDPATGKQVGTVGSTARHHELGPIGLALIKRNTATDAELSVGGVAASQEVIVDPEIGLHVRARL